MAELKLEVGKSYEVRDVEFAERNDQPTYVTIIEFIKGNSYPYVCDQYQSYMENGRAFNNKPTPYDLVREVQPNKQEE